MNFYVVYFFFFNNKAIINFINKYMYIVKKALFKKTSNNLNQVIKLKNE